MTNLMNYIMTDIMVIHFMIHLMIHIMIHIMNHIMINIMIHLMTYIMTKIMINMTNLMINVMTAWKKVHSHSGQLSNFNPISAEIGLFFFSRDVGSSPTGAQLEQFELKSTT